MWLPLSRIGRLLTGTYLKHNCFVWNEVHFLSILARVCHIIAYAWLREELYYFTDHLGIITDSMVEYLPLKKESAPGFNISNQKMAENGY